MHDPWAPPAPPAIRRPVELRRRRRRGSALLVAAATLVTAGCSSGGGRDDAGGSERSDGSRSPVTTAEVEVVGDPASTAAALEQREWVLTDTSLDLAADTEVTLRVERGEVVGSSGCNTYQGPVAVDDGAWAAGPFRLTALTCEGEVAESEERVLDALESADRVEVGTDRLVLRGPDGLEMVFTTPTPVDVLLPETFVGRWAVRSIGAAGEPDRAPLPGSDPLLVVAGDGTLGGVLGCNTVSGQWVLAGGSLTFEGLETTETACTEPAGVMEQEAAVVGALAASRTVAYEGGDGLTLRDGDGTPVLALERSR